MSALELSHVPMLTARDDDSLKLRKFEETAVSQSEDNGLIWIEAGGTLRASDYDSSVLNFERITQRNSGTVQMPIELAPDFSGWNIGGLRRDLNFAFRHKVSFGRIALVGDQRSEKWGTRIFDRLFRTELQVFPFSKCKQAENWIQARGVNA